MASPSLLSCLEVVPEAIRLWKPETAPQATVMNRVGNSILLPTVKPLKGVRITVGLEPRMPMTAAAIMKYSRTLFR